MKLQQLKKSGLRFILIGGWACFLWTHSHKSKDIDLVVELEELPGLKQLHELKKNARLKKYEFFMEEVDVDVYVPFYSRLALPLEKLRNETTKIEGFTVLRPEPLLLLKQGAEMARGKSVKGLKDRIDIMDLLLKSGFDFRRYSALVEEFALHSYRKRLIELVQGFREHSHLDLNPRELKKAKHSILEKLKHG